MTSLVGFRSSRRAKKSGKGGGGFTDSQAVALLTSSLGKNPTISDITSVQDRLKKLGSEEAQVADVKLKAQKVDMLNERVILSNGISDIESNLRNNLNSKAAGSFSNPYALSRDYAEQYSLAVEAVQARLDGLFESGRATQENIAALNEQKDKYMEKVKFYDNLRSSYYQQNSRGVPGPEDPTQYVYVPEVNPSTNKFSAVQIMKTSDLKDKGYMIADIKVQVAEGMGEGLPMAVPVHEVGKTDDGKPIMGATVGRINFRQEVKQGKSGSWSVSPNIIAQEEDEGWFGEKKDAAGNSISETNMTIRDAKKNGLKLGEANHYGFDSSDMESGSLLRSGSRVFYKTDTGKVLEVSGESTEAKFKTLANYLKNSGKDSQTISNTLHRERWVDSNFISKKLDPESKINNDSFSAPSTSSYGPFLPGTEPKSMSMPEPQKASFFSNRNVSTPMDNQPSSISLEGAFQNRTNAPNKPDAPKISSNVKNPAADIIGQGVSFFRKMLS